MHRHLSLLFIMLVLSVPTRAAEPTIVTSVHPLALVVKEVVGDDARVSVLVPPNVSPHNYSMKPSGRERLARADLVVWLGPGMEPFLSRLMDDSSLAHKSITLHHDEPAPRSDHRDHPGNHSHGADSTDPHVWLDPDKVRAMLPTLIESLTAIRGLDREILEDNRQAFLQRLDNTEASIRHRLENLPPMELFTYHGAFQHFADHFGLTISGTLSPDPQRKPGAQHLAELRRQLANANHPCLMTEPQFSRNWWRGLSLDKTLSVSHWDPLGTDIEPAHAGYTRLLEQLAEAVAQCHN